MKVIVVTAPKPVAVKEDNLAKPLFPLMVVNLVVISIELNNSNQAVISCGAAHGYEEVVWYWYSPPGTSSWSWAPGEAPIQPEATDDNGLHEVFAICWMKAFSPAVNVDSKGTETTLQLASRDELEDKLLRPVDWKVGGVMDGEFVGEAL
mmetsp:Transcript_5175/g.7255  ORF Transcript_5175/g.7255 Transcript_5175/m.7255 type:complete len:150 (+) Transcript_5175:1449-1898(+)